MEKRLKPSIYAYTTEADNGDLILFNAGYGIKSIKKIEKTRKIR